MKSQTARVAALSHHEFIVVVVYIAASIAHPVDEAGHIASQPRAEGDVLELLLLELELVMLAAVVLVVQPEGRIVRVDLQREDPRDVGALLLGVHLVVHKEGGVERGLREGCCGTRRRGGGRDQHVLQVAVVDGEEGAIGREVLQFSLQVKLAIISIAHDLLGKAQPHVRRLFFTETVARSRHPCLRLSGLHVV